MSVFWHLFVVVLTVLSILGCLWLLLAQSRGKTGPETTHVWDDDLTEYNNPLPRWWLNLFLLTIVFAVGYLVFYPGLGTMAGRLGWSSEQEMQDRLALLTAQRQAQYAPLAGLPVAALVDHESARNLGRSVFVSHCAGCHGTDARGAIGFPDLTDDDWLYGGDAETLVASIARGRGGQMPSFIGSVSAEKLDALLAFLPYWSDPELPAKRREAGMKAFSGTCSACHGADGTGNPALGAPDLTDDVWLWGQRRDQIRHSILYGRHNRMPPHDGLLTEDEIRVVAAYVLSLSQSPGVTP